jgi:hypothetical protein
MAFSEAQHQKLAPCTEMPKSVAMRVENSEVGHPPEMDVVQ